MDEARIRRLVQQLGDDVSTADDAWSELRELGADVVPHLATCYPTARRWQQRTALVFHAIRYARTSEEAFQLGLTALADRSYMVRYRACGLLAYSLRRDAIPALEELLTHRDKRTVEDARAALDAIKRRNHHLFVDRDHSGRSFWEVNPGDLPEPEAKPWWKVW